jgi:hypothetical protein
MRRAAANGTSVTLFRSNYSYSNLVVRFAIILSIIHTFTWCWAHHGSSRQIRRLSAVASAFQQPSALLSQSSSRRGRQQRQRFLSLQPPLHLFARVHRPSASSVKQLRGKLSFSAEATPFPMTDTMSQEERSVVDHLFDCIGKLPGDDNDKELWVQEACEILERAATASSTTSFVLSDDKGSHQAVASSENPTNHRRLCELAVEISSQLCRIGSGDDSGRKRKQTWTDLQGFSQRLLLDYATNKTMEPSIPSTRSNVLAISLVFGVLALIPPNSSGAKGAASALATTVTSVWKGGKEAASTEEKDASIVASSDMLQVFLQHAIEHKTTAWNWNTITQFTRAFQLTEASHPRLANLVAQVIRQQLQRVNDLAVDHASGDDTWEKRKQIVSGVLALACQVRPWSSSSSDDKQQPQDGGDSSMLLSPLDLVEIAIPLDYWHAAEQICQSASGVASPSDVGRTVEYLVDTSLEERTYRRADTLATNLYSLGGRSRFVVARFQHACDTISQIVYKHQLPIIERQVTRVDKAVEKVKQDPVSAVIAPTTDTSVDEPFDPSQEIRIFALMRLEEAEEHDSAHRLATLWNMDYVYDEEAILAAAAARRKKYVQFGEVLPGPVPDIISDPKTLRETFVQFWRQGAYPRGPFGLDAEWEGDVQGVDLLQLSHPKQAMLLDIPALVSSKDGILALKETVGALLDSSDSVVVGFACRQDLNRLRNTQGKHADAWLTGTQAVVDMQPLVVKREPELAAISSSVGLSRVCQYYLDKPLDKSEQCSFWGARPLSERQRSYAALDAWVCAAVYEKLYPTMTIR